MGGGGGWYAATLEVMDGHFVAGFIAGVCTTLAAVLVLSLLVVVVRRLLALRSRSWQPTSRGNGTGGGGYRPVARPFGEDDEAPLSRELTDLTTHRHQSGSSGVFVIDDDDGDDYRRGIQEPHEPKRQQQQQQRADSIDSLSFWDQLCELPVIEPDHFQQLWTDTDLRASIGLRLRPGVDVEKLLALHRVACIASGQVGSQSKYYFFAQKGDLGFLVELLVSSTSHEMTAKVKCEDDDAARLFVRHLGELLRR